MATSRWCNPVPHRMRGMEEDKERHTLWEQNVIEEKQNMQMLVDKILLSMPENEQRALVIIYITARVHT